MEQTPIREFWTGTHGQSCSIYLSAEARTFLRYAQRPLVYSRCFYVKFIYKSQLCICLKIGKCDVVLYRPEVNNPCCFPVFRNIPDTRFNRTFNRCYFFLPSIMISPESFSPSDGKTSSIFLPTIIRIRSSFVIYPTFFVPIISPSFKTVTRSAISNISFSLWEIYI